MSLISLIATVIVVILSLWLVDTYIPMKWKIKKILNLIVGICLVVWLLCGFGVLDHSGDIFIPRIK